MSGLNRVSDPKPNKDRVTIKQVSLSIALFEQSMHCNVRARYLHSIDLSRCQEQWAKERPRKIASSEGMSCAQFAFMNEFNWTRDKPLRASNHTRVEGCSKQPPAPASVRFSLAALVPFDCSAMDEGLRR